MGKKADQPKAKGAAKASAKADGALAIANAAETPKVTAAHLTDVQEAVKAIEMHPVLKDISSAPPLSKEPDAFGLQTMKTPYSKKHFEDSMKMDKTCEFAGNFFWCNLLYQVSPGVPVNARAMRSLSDRFSKPCEFPDALVMATSQTVAAEGPSTGTWERIMPDELVHAYLHAVARDARDPTVPPAVMKQWRKHLLSCPFKIVHAVGDDVLWKSLKWREDSKQKALAVGRTVLQRIYDVVNYLQRNNCLPGIGVKKSPAVTKLAKAYADHVQVVGEQVLLASNLQCQI